MFRIASEESYGDGQLIVEEGGGGDWIYIVLSGRVELSRTVSGKKFVIERVKPGEVFGEFGFYGGIARTLAARAVGTARVGIIDRTALDEEMNRLSEGFKTVLNTTMTRFRNMVERATAFSLRSETRIPVSLSVMYRDENSFFKVVTEDLSAGGLFIRSESLLAAGERCLVNLRLPDRSDSVIIKCEVVWVRRKGSGEEDGPSPGMGVKFIDMSDRDREVFEQYLDGLSEGAAEVTMVSGQDQKN
jgi:uncharacterized protein (TIGR02266 family)